MRQNRVHVRLLMVAGVVLLWTTAVFGRLSYLQLFAHGEYLARAQRQQQRTIEITPKRGIIYDRNMHALAMSVPVKSAFAVPAEIADESMAAGLLSGVLGVPQDVLEARMASSRSFVWISRKLPPEKVGEGFGRDRVSARQPDSQQERKNCGDGRCTAALV